MAAALLVSVTLHLAAAWWFSRARPGGLVSVPRQPPIEIQVVEVPAEVSRVPQPTPVATPVRSPTRRAQRPSAAPPAAEAPAVSAAPSSPAPPGAPRRIDLTPHLQPPGEGPAGTGHTVTNHPESAEEHGIAIAEEAGRVKGRVDGWIAADLEERKAQLGLIDPYFGS
ncbi:MAG TPA: hypothetical protein VFA20_10125, partial [Myxococcaceae bacterium]|nr:hypothetical protein [Myxococcaceae bacterium]